MKRLSLSSPIPLQRTISILPPPSPSVFSCLVCHIMAYCRRYTQVLYENLPSGPSAIGTTTMTWPRDTDTQLRYACRRASFRRISVRRMLFHLMAIYRIQLDKSSQVKFIPLPSRISFLPSQTQHRLREVIKVGKWKSCHQERKIEHFGVTMAKPLWSHAEGMGREKRK
jgi:hypothetical protein